MARRVLFERGNHRSSPLEERGKGRGHAGVDGGTLQAGEKGVPEERGLAGGDRSEAKAKAARRPVSARDLTGRVLVKEQHAGGERVVQGESTTQFTYGRREESLDGG